MKRLSRNQKNEEMQKVNLENNIQERRKTPDVQEITEKKISTKGVTLISLVVTIVVLLILAGISVAILSGDNGILKSAQRAQEQSKLADIREEVDIKWVEVLKEAGPTHTTEELEQKLQEKLRQEDENAVVKYRPENDTFEITYKDMMLEIQNNDSVTVKREDWKENIEDIFGGLDPDLSLEDKADKIDEELKKDDPNSSAEYNPDTGEIDISHGDYTGSVDEEGNVEVKDPVVKEKPSIEITTEPSDVSIIEKGTATFSVSAITKGDVTYQWYQNDVESDTTGTAIDGANSERYTTEMLNADSRNIYFYCEITATLNGEAVTKKTRIAKVNIFGKVEIAGDENTEKIVLEGDNASFEITASGEGDLSYQWYKNSENSSSGETAIPNAVNPTYTIEDVTGDDDNTYYYCVVTQKKDGASASVSSNPIKLTVLENLKITGEPSNAETIVGNEVTFEVKAEGAGELRYEWYRNTTNSTEGGTPIPGANSSTYTIPAGEITTSLNGSYYYCKITQVYNEQELKTVNTKVVSLSVIEKAGITVQPTNQGALEGNTAVFDVEVSGEGDIKYQWYKNTKNSTENGTPIQGANSASYTTGNLTLEDNNTYYYCVITQNYGGKTETVTTDTAKLEVAEKVKVTVNPQAQSRIEGTSVTFESTAVGGGTLTYQWYKNTANSNTGGTPITGATSSAYTVTSTTTGMSGTYYYCVITQKYGSSTTTISTNTALLTVKGKLTITKQPSGQDKLEGNNAVFSVTASGEGELSYQWYSNKNNSNTGGTKISNATSSTYTTSAVTTAMNGTYYYCVVTQKYGSSTAEISSNTAMLTVGAKVKVTTNPSAQNMITGNKATFTVSATGDGDLSYQWYVNNSNSTSGGTAIQSATNSSYTTGNTTTDMSGKYYYCVITQNYQGQTASATSGTALLTVIAKASVTKNPTAVSVIAGKTNASFSITASGTGNLSYQWYKNTSNSTSGGSPISGATSNTYTISANNISTSLNNTYYYCVVTQEYNGQTAEVSSSAGMLTVVSPVSVTTQPSNVTVTVGNSAKFSVIAKGEGTLSYQWYSSKTNSNTGGTPITGATNAIYTITAGNVTTSLNNTYYYCVVTQTYGSSTKTAISGTAQLTVIAGVTIKTQPTAQSVYESKPASFTVAVNGEGTITYQWYSNSTNSTSGGSKITGATNATYTISSTTSSLNGKYYYCVITQKYGSPNQATATVTTTPVKLTVTTTTITADSTSITVYVGGSNGTVTLGGTNAGAFSISQQPNGTYATASISGSKITIIPKALGSTSLIAKESNGNATVTINIIVKTANYSITSSSSTSYYDFLKDAISEVQDGQTIKVLRDVTESGIAIIDKNIYLNVQNFTLATSIMVDDNNTLTLLGEGIIEGNSDAETTLSVSSGASLILDDSLMIWGELWGTIRVYSGGKFIMNSGIISTGNSMLFTLIVDGGGTAYINGGVVDSTYAAIVSSGEVNIGNEQYELSIDYPLIKGDNAGIVPMNENTTKGTIKFYNGVIYAGQVLYDAELVDIREGYIIKEEEEEEMDLTYKKAYLGREYISTSNDYRGYYADIDGNGSVDGIIYADLAKGGSGQWRDSWGIYEYSAVTSGLKNYYVSQEGYEGPFGTMDVLTAEGRGNDRFYVMALEDIEDTHSWYYNAGEKLDDTISASTDDFGEGRENTKKMIANWNKNGVEDSYGKQDENDIWGIIQSKVGDINNPTWFVPSKSEWSAFGDYLTKNLGLTTSNYNNKFGLNSSYWSSSQHSTSTAYGVRFNGTPIRNRPVVSYERIRLSAIF